MTNNVKNAGKFSGTRVLIGCFFYILIMQGACGIYNGAYALLPGAFGVDHAYLGSAMSFLTGGIAISSLLLAKFNKLVRGLRGCMTTGSVLLLIIGLCYLFIDSPIVLFIMYFCTGCITGLAGHAIVTEVVANWYTKGRATRTGIVIAAIRVGEAAFISIMGFLLVKVAVTVGMGVTYVVLAVISFIIGRFVIIPTPEEVGQTPYGGYPEAAPAAPEMKKATKEDNFRLYKNPAFWFFVIGCLFSGCTSWFLVTYGPTAMMEAGIDFTTASQIVSIMNILGAVFTLFSGKIMEKLSVKKFIVFIYSAGVICNWAFAFMNRSKSPAMAFAFIVLGVIGFLIANNVQFRNNIIAPELFDRRDRLNAVSKLYSVSNILNMFIMPVYGMIIDKLGFFWLYIIGGLTSIPAMLFILIALRTAVKRKEIA